MDRQSRGYKLWIKFTILSFLHLFLRVAKAAALDLAATLLGPPTETTFHL